MWGQGNLASVILDLITLSSDPTIYSDHSGKSIVTDLIFLVVLALQNKPFKGIQTFFKNKLRHKKQLPLYTSTMFNINFLSPLEFSVPFSPKMSCLC